MKFEGKSQRIRERLRLSLPARVRCRESAEVEWEEVTRLLDVTPFGAGFSLSRPTERGRLLYLILPMPRQLRCYDYTEDQYRVWSLVRRIQAIPSDVGEDKTRYEIGVAFIGKRLPVSAEQDPTKLYDVTHQTETGLWALREQRDRATEERLHTLVERETRHSIPVGVTVAVIGEKGKITASETTVTENISQHGAAVFTTLDVERGSFVRLISAQYQISVLAEVRGQSKGAGGINRLHLSFVDRVWPLEGIE